MGSSMLQSSELLFGILWVAGPVYNSFYFYYVDGTFIVWPHGRSKLEKALLHLNSTHPSVAFTMELV